MHELCTEESQNETKPEAKSQASSEEIIGNKGKREKEGNTWMIEDHTFGRVSFEPS